MRAFNFVPALFLAAALTACDETQPVSNTPTAPATPRSTNGGASSVFVVNVSNDTTAQNETPLAVNPLNSQNFITGGNDWNYNYGCSVNASLDGGRTWTNTLPNGFIPGITKYTNDPSVPGTGAYDAGGDPAIAFGPNGTAYYACFGYQATPPYSVALLLSRSYDGGLTWLSGGAAQPLTLVTAFKGNGKARGSTGQFSDHDAMTVASDGTIYVAWAQFHGYGTNSPVYVATSNDNGLSFNAPVKVTSGPTRNNQDQRIVTNADGSVAYLVFDNSIQGGKGAAMFVSQSTDHGRTWSKPVPLGGFENPVCLYPPYCFNITGGAFRGPGSYPAPAYNNANGRLYVAYADIVNGHAKILISSASSADLTSWTAPSVVASVGSGDRFGSELSIAANGRIDVAFYDRSYSGNALVDVTYATSSDFGATWQSTRVTQSGFDPSQYGVPDGSSIRPFIGDYNGIVSLPGSAAMTWTGPGTTYGTLPTNLEIYFGSVIP
jgi:hypothetical protein